MSAFGVLFLFSLFSFAIDNRSVLKVFALFGLVVASYFVSHGYVSGLSGFALDSSTIFFETILLIIVGAYIIAEKESMTIIQTLFLTTASIALLESATLITFVISFEAVSIISFVVVSQIQNATQAQGAVKMFIAGAIATALIMLGVTLYLFEGHSLTMPIKEMRLFGSVGIWIMLLGLFYKLTIVPMHTWAADSYAQIRPSHAALLSGIVKTVVVLAVFKITSPFLIHADKMTHLLLITLAITTMTLGNILALFQTQLTKILSYSSIAHAGYMLLAFVAIKSEFASTALLYIAIAYIFMQTALFMLVESVAEGRNDLKLSDLKGYATKNKTTSLLFTIQLFSLAGIPLLAGFLAKAVLVYAVVDVDLPLVALFVLLNSALSVGYYAWIVKHLYFDSKSDTLVSLSSLNRGEFFAQLVLLAGTLYFGIFAYAVFEV